MLQVDNEKNELVFDNENDAIVYAAIPFSREVTRAEIVKLTGIARTTVYDCTVRLLFRRLITRTEEEIRRVRGRPKVFYRRKYVDV